MLTAQRTAAVSGRATSRLSPALPSRLGRTLVIRRFRSAALPIAAPATPVLIPARLHRGCIPAFITLHADVQCAMAFHAPQG